MCGRPKRQQGWTFREDPCTGIADGSEYTCIIYAGAFAVFAFYFISCRYDKILDNLNASIHGRCR